MPGFAAPRARAASGRSAPLVAPLVAALLAHALAAAAPAAGAQPRVAAATADFRAYWAAFRSAALAGDTARVAALTRFPFRTRGEMDVDPVRRHGRTAFPTLFVRRALAVDPGLSAEPTTMRALIEHTVVPDAGAVAPDGRYARVGAFVFERVARSGGTAGARPPRVWRFVQAYLDDDS